MPEKLDDGAVTVGVKVAMSIGSEAFLLVLDPGYHDHGRGVVCAGEVGRAAAGGGPRQAAVVGVATAAGAGIVAEPGGQPAAAPVEHMWASRDQVVQAPMSLVGIHRKP